MILCGWKKSRAAVLLVWEKGRKRRLSEWCGPRLLSFCLSSSAFQGTWLPRCMDVSLRDDNRICWECGLLLYPPYVTTWSGLTWVSSPEGRQRPAPTLRRHEGCSGLPEDVDPGSQKVGAMERPCESCFFLF